jgi:hypothetical protein
MSSLRVEAFRAGDGIGQPGAGERDEYEVDRGGRLLDELIRPL